jgi:hypothetical protein
MDNIQVKVYNQDGTFQMIDLYKEDGTMNIHGSQAPQYNPAKEV